MLGHKLSQVLAADYQTAVAIRGSSDRINQFSELTRGLENRGADHPRWVPQPG